METILLKIDGQRIPKDVLLKFLSVLSASGKTTDDLGVQAIRRVKALPVSKQRKAVRKRARVQAGGSV